MDRLHIKKRRWRDTKECTTLEPLKETGREEDREIAGEDRQTRKRVEASSL